MKINIRKDMLIENLNIVSKAVSSKSTMEILECVLLIADENGFRLLANDMEIGIESSNIESDIEELGIVALDAKMFFEIVRNMPEDNISIEVDEKNIAIIKSGKAEFKILGHNGAEYPRLEDIEKNNRYSIPASTFKNLIRQTIFSVSLEESKPILTGELIEIKDSFLNVVAIDGFRVALRSISVNPEYEDISIVVPSKALSEIIKIIPDKNDCMIEMYFTKNQVLFEMENCIMIARLLEGEYIKYEQLFLEEFKTKVGIKKDLFLKTLERASLISKENKKVPVKLEIKSNDTMVVTSNSDISTSYDEINIEFEGNELNIAFNPKYLIDALKAIEEGEISLHFMTELSPCIIKSSEDSDVDYKYLILPLRID